MKKDMLLDVNMSHGKMSDFVSFSMLGFTLVITLRNFDYWNSSNFLDKKKNDVRFDYVQWNSVWFGLSFVVWVEFW